MKMPYIHDYNNSFESSNVFSPFYTGLKNSFHIWTLIYQFSAAFEMFTVTLAVLFFSVGSLKDVYV